MSEPVTAFDDNGSASTGFILLSGALVFVMTPGVGLFYAGLVRSKNALTLIFVSFLAAAVVTLQWFLFGFSLTFSETGGGFIGNFDLGGLTGLGMTANAAAPAVPAVVFCFYQLMFATVTPSIIFGSIAERIRLIPALTFIFFWTTLVYDFTAYWTWGAHGWLKHLSCLDTLDCGVGAIDYAGGGLIKTADLGPVHIASGFAGLAFCIFLGKPKKSAPRPHNVTMVFLGTILLWFGWFAFNGGSALASTPRAAMAALISASTAGLTWVFMDYMSSRKMSGVSFCSGVLAGLVTITPGSGFVSPWASVIFGIVGAASCNLAVRAKEHLGYDDQLDAFGLHGVGGMVGAILTGIFHQGFITTLDGGSSNGGAIEGNVILVGYQIAAVLSIAAYSFIVTYAILFVLELIPGVSFKATDAHEDVGFDLVEMGEIAYAYDYMKKDLGMMSNDTKGDLSEDGDIVEVIKNGEIVSE